MSVSAAADLKESEGLLDAHALAFRVAFAAAVGLTLGYVLGWDFPFLPPLFAVQLLTGSHSLKLKQAIGFVVLMVAGCVFSVIVAQAFVQTPFVLVLVIGLLVFVAFLMLARQQAVPVASVLLITTAIVPLVSVSSIELAYGLVYTLIAGSILAVLLVFLAYAFFPARNHADEIAETPPAELVPARAALANTAVLMSLVLLLIFSGSSASVIVLMTAITILRQPVVAGHGAAYGFIMGNLVGGLAATGAYSLVALFPSPAILLLVALLFGLIFGARIAQGGDSAPIYVVGLVTFLIVLGLGLAPLPSDSGSVFITRLFNVVIAAAYTIGTASLLRWLLHTQGHRPRAVR